MNYGGLGSGSCEMGECWRDGGQNALFEGTLLTAYVVYGMVFCSEGWGAMAEV